MVIIGVLAGPSVVTCFNSDGNMGVCLRGKMTEAGILPAPAATAAIEDATPAEPAPEAPAAEVAAVEPAAEVPAEPAAPAAETTTVPDSLIAATFGLLRAEPDGSVVIAGSGTPGSEVEVFSNGELLGKTTVENSGDWVIVPDAPLPPGGTEITLGEEGKDGLAAESFVVAINEDKTSEPLVVASKPGEASDVLQGIAAPADVAVAAADPADVTPTPDAAAPAAETAAPAAEVVPPTETPATPTESTAPVETAEAPAAPETPAVEPAPADVAVAATESAATDTPAVEPAAEPADTTAPAAPATEPTPAATPDVAVAAVEPETATPAVTLEGAPPTIDAIEIEGDNTFFAGGGPEGATMRLYVDDTFVADAEVKDGRWLVEAGDVLKQPSQRVRIDMLQPGSSKVASRAEVNFVIELPTEEAPTALAQADIPEAPATDPAAPASIDTPAAPAAEATATPEAPAAVPAAEAPAVETPPAPETTPPAPAEPTTPAEPAPDAEPAAPAEVTPEPVAPAEQPAAAVEAPAATTEPSVPAEAPAPSEAVEPAEPAAPVTEPAAPAVEPSAPAVEPAAPAEAPAAEPAAPAAEPAAPAEAPADPAPDVPTMVAVAVGDPDAQRFASGKAIIRSGDNLWTIARRVYGEGIRYTTIYQANTGQIRDPDRIYPGQVFELPEGTQN